ncbi:MAG: iron-sulfur cluster assembly scaffold protein [Candidatus Nealsonbacteria bacterium]|nr:MAG: iron-sulfur cluster assembly scaffold protein [Candidatus Nealsonbacteria bacterium]
MEKIGPYTKKVMEYFKNPRNFGRIKNPDGVGKVGNPICGDIMWLYIKVRKDKKGREIIKDIKFETFGCVAAIATSSVITDLARGKTLKEAIKIDRRKIVKSLGGLPPIKIHCSVLAAGALSEAIYDYLSKKKKEIPKELQERHRGLEREKKEIEKRYKEWIKIEEKMHKK